MKKWKRILLWTAIVTGTTTALLLITTAVYSWTLEKQLEEKLAAIKAEGDPICLADLARKPVPNEQNGATYFLKFYEELRLFDRFLCSIIEQRNMEGYDYWPEDIGKIEEMLNKHAGIYGMLEEAVETPDFYTNQNYSDSPEQLLKKIDADGIKYQFQAGYRYLGARKTVLMAKGNRDEALSSVILSSNLSRQLHREPLLTNFFTSHICSLISFEGVNEVLQSGPISEQTRQKLDADLSKYRMRENVVHALKTERAYCISNFLRDFSSLTRSPLQISQELRVLDMYETFLSYVPQPFSSWADKEPEKQPPSDAPYGVLAEEMRPALRKAIIFSYRTEARVHALRIINALQSKNLKEGERIPTMAELGLPAEVGIDPFNGKPMIIKRTTKGWLVYSVDKNLKDDGGDFKTPLDCGFGPNGNH